MSQNFTNGFDRDLIIIFFIWFNEIGGTNIGIFFEIKNRGRVSGGKSRDFWKILEIHTSIVA